MLVKEKLYLSFEWVIWYCQCELSYGLPAIDGPVWSSCFYATCLGYCFAALSPYGFALPFVMNLQDVLHCRLKLHSLAKQSGCWEADLISEVGLTLIPLWTWISIGHCLLNDRSRMLIAHFIVSPPGRNVCTILLREIKGTVSHCWNVRWIRDQQVTTYNKNIYPSVTSVSQERLG